MGDGIFKWYVGRGAQPENYTSTCDSRDEAIEVGRNEYHADGDGFTICEADKAVLGANFSEDSIAERIIEDLEESNHECWGEDGPDDPWPAGAKADLEQRLRATVAAWLKAFPPTTWRFGVERNEEFFPAPLRARVFCELNQLSRWEQTHALHDHDPNAIAIDLTTGDGEFVGEEIDIIALTSHIIEWQDEKKGRANG